MHNKLNVTNLGTWLPLKWCLIVVAVVVIQTAAVVVVAVTSERKKIKVPGVGEEMVTKGSGYEGLATTNLVDEVTDFESRPQLKAHVLHHHVTVQQQKCFAIYLLKCTCWSSFGAFSVVMHISIIEKETVIQQVSVNFPSLIKDCLNFLSKL